MQVIKINQKSDNEGFRQAHDLANEKAKSVLGECLNVASFNGETKLVSPTQVACSTTEKSDCGAESYARSNGAELEVEVNDHHKFYYRSVKEDYSEASPSPFEGYEKAGVDKAEWP